MVAAFTGNVNVLNWVRGKGYHPDSSACRAAVWEGNLEVLKWMKEAKADFGSEVCFVAAEHGQIEVLEWLKEEVPEAWDAKYCLESAVLYNQPRVLHWAVGEGIPLSQDTCETTAIVRSLEVLQFAREQGCPVGWGNKLAGRQRGPLAAAAVGPRAGVPLA